VTMPSAVFNPAQSRQTRGPAPPNRIVRPACLSTNSEIQIGQWEQLFDVGKLGPCGFRRASLQSPLTCVLFIRQNRWDGGNKQSVGNVSTIRLPQEVIHST
jgi:hypothetical protein